MATYSMSTDAASTHVRLAVPTDPIPNVAEMINRAYQVGERGILVDNAENPMKRITTDDLQQLVSAGKLLVAVVTETNEIVGCIKVDFKNEQEGVGQWGLFAVDVMHQRKGLGRLLVQAAEQQLISRNCNFAELELLAPTHWKHSHKEMIRNWYTTSLGYQLKVPNDYDASTERLRSGTRSVGCEGLLLATDADVTSYRKALSTL
jgi:predicted N-acetyltransferase YhbS